MPILNIIDLEYPKAPATMVWPQMIIILACKSNVCIRQCWVLGFRVQDSLGFYLGHIFLKRAHLDEGLEGANGITELRAAFPPHVHQPVKGIGS